MQSYLKNDGVMEFNEEVFDYENFPYLLSFGRENDSIKGLVFNDTFVFANDMDKSINLATQVLSTFNKESITSIRFRGNYLSDQPLKVIVSSIH